MKRLFSLYALFFYICALATPHSSYAILPLGVIPAAEIGATVAFAALAGTATTAAIKSNGTITANASDLKTVYAPLVYYNQVMQAGAQVALGRTFQAILDVEELYNSGVMKANAAFSDLLETIFPSTPDYGDNLNGLNVACNPSIAACTPGKVAHMVLVSDTAKAIQYGTTVAMLQSYLDTVITPVTYGYGTNGTHYNYQGNVYTQSYNARLLNGLAYADQRTYNVTYLSGTPTGAVLPDTLNDDQAKAIAAALPAAAAANPAVKSAINSAIAANPSLVKAAPPAITAADIAAAVQSGTAAANQTLVDTLTALVAANPTDAALQAELAKALAEQAKEQLEDVEETFNPLSPSGFGEAYNPGEFDIPARFTTFLQNVKSSWLCSVFCRSAP